MGEWGDVCGGLRFTSLGEATVAFQKTHFPPWPQREQAGPTGSSVRPGAEGLDLEDPVLS